MTPSTVLFVCPDNALLGPLAEAYLNSLAPQGIRAFSAGPNPRGTLHPLVRRLLQDHGLDAQGLEPKSWDIFMLPHAPQPDRVVALTDSVAGGHQPDWPGNPRRTLWQVAACEAESRPESLAACSEYFRRIRRCIDQTLAQQTAPVERQAQELLLASC